MATVFQRSMRLNQQSKLERLRTKNVTQKIDTHILIEELLIVNDEFIYIQNYQCLPDKLKKLVEQALISHGIRLTYLKNEPTTLVVPHYVVFEKGEKNFAEILARILNIAGIEKLGFEHEFARKLGRIYKKKLNFRSINRRVKAFAKYIRKNGEMIDSILLQYETYEVVLDEKARTLDLLDNIGENSDYFQREIRSVATFLPSNQPLYALTCFALIPALMAKEVYVKEPVVMSHFFFDLIACLNLEKFFPNVYIVRKTREDFVAERSAIIRFAGGQKNPLTDVVIFTGSKENADKLRQTFHSNTLFIANGSGHNPFVVTDTAKLDKAVKDALQIQLYNQGQDCSAPNAILVHSNVYTQFVVKLRQELKKVTFGPYKNRSNRVGPISKKKDLERIQKIFIENAAWLDRKTPGTIHTKSGIVEPTIILKPLNKGGNYKETFAPIFFIQKYEKDEKLASYFETPEYEMNAMFIALYGNSDYINKITGRAFPCGRILHPRKTIIRNSNSHTQGFERGTQEYGGYGRGASSISIYGQIIPKPTLPQRDIFEYLVRPSMQLEQLLMKGEKNQKNNRNKLIFKKKNGANDLAREHTHIHLSPEALTSSASHWTTHICNQILDAFPDRNALVCAAAINPSWLVDVNGLRNILSASVVQQCLKNQHKTSELVLYWRDLEPLDEIPIGADAFFQRYIGMPLLSVPDPLGEYDSYVMRIENDLKSVLLELNIRLLFRRQSEVYLQERFNELVIRSLREREQIANLIYKYIPEQRLEMTLDQFQASYYPIDVFSRFSGKVTTEIIDYNGDTRITYRCLETGGIETIDIREKRCIKLKSVIDQSAQWLADGVSFAVTTPKVKSVPSHFYTSIAIFNKVFGGSRSPILLENEIVGLQGVDRLYSNRIGQMFSLHKILEIYDPLVLKWLYIRHTPYEKFHLSFNEEIFSQYEECDRQVQQFANGKFFNSKDKTAIGIAINGVDSTSFHPFSFGQIVALGQLVDWESSKFQLLLKELGIKADFSLFKSRWRNARCWLEHYNLDQRITLLQTANTKYLSQMSDSSVDQICRLRHLLKEHSLSIAEIETRIYEIPKSKSLTQEQNKKRQRDFFKDVYQLLLGKETGPRLSTFLWAVDKSKVLDLLAPTEHADRKNDEK